MTDITIPNKGDRIREDANPKDGSYSLACLVREGEFIGQVPVKGMSDEFAFAWAIKLDNGKQTFFNPKESEIIEKAITPDLVANEVNQSLPEQTFKVGDRVRDNDGFVGEITFVSSQCINVKGDHSIKSYNLVELTNIDEFLKCLPTSICSGELEHSPLPPATLEKSPPLLTAISPKTRKKSTKAISLKSPSTETSTITTPAKESISTQGDFPAQELAPLALKQDSTTKTQNSGFNICESSTKDTPDLSSSKTPLDYSIVEWERSSQAYPPAGMMRSGKFSALPCLEVPKKEKGSLSLPTLMTGLGKTRNAGATKCERYLRDKQFLQDTQALSVEMMAILFGFPMDWAQCLLESPKESKDAMKPEHCLEEQSTSTAPPSSLSESSTLIEFSGNNIDARLEMLLDRAKQLTDSGAAPEGVWLSSAKVRDREFYQVQWRSRVQHPWLGNQKSRYVGIADKEEHKSAIAQHLAGQELRKIEKEIKKLQQVKS